MKCNHPPLQTPFAKLKTFLEQHGKILVDDDFCTWAFGTHLRQALVMTRKEMFDSWNDLHFDDLELTNDGSQIADARKMADLWRTNKRKT